MKNNKLKILVGFGFVSSIAALSATIIHVSVASKIEKNSKNEVIKLLDENIKKINDHKNKLSSSDFVDGDYKKALEDYKAFIDLYELLYSQPKINSDIDLIKKMNQSKDILETFPGFLTRLNNQLIYNENIALAKFAHVIFDLFTLRNETRNLTSLTEDRKKVIISEIIPNLRKGIKNGYKNSKYLRENSEFKNQDIKYNNELEAILVKINSKSLINIMS
ncbi:hypothetical protein MCFN_00135 [Mycoplasmopsis californica]|uniref:Lipoprotein n=1 Tax=Mycoplasmopsis californica TaxID=2113 RepID=A0A059XVB9_9BACT|nr:hypothetical protein [Mycoplasmopsis californica]AIA29207.1 hypothetical protein MCFN_00135 [Mycoplasmopsis californica]